MLQFLDFFNFLNFELSQYRHQIHLYGVHFQMIALWTANIRSVSITRSDKKHGSQIQEILTNT